MKRMKKGFTIVELVIVIAVIAILAGVLIPTFSNVVRKAKISSDTQIVRNLNVALMTESSVGNQPDTMTEALAIAKDYGYDVVKINYNTADGNEILWDSANNVFCYLNDNDVQYIPEAPATQTTLDADLWVISDSVSTKYSTYYTGDATEPLVVTKGFDAGEKVVDVEFKTNATISTIIRTNGGKLTINAENATIEHYGEADEVIIEKVDTQSYHEYGIAQFTEVKEGHYVVEETGFAKILVAPEAIINALPVSANIATTYNAEEVTSEDIDGLKEGAKLFADGIGTEAKPYIIKNAEQLANIKEVADFKYYQVANGVEIIDCANYNGRTNSLNGVFDGNGVNLTNLNYLFNTVGTCEAEGNDGGLSVVIKNLTATFATTAGGGVVRSNGASTLKFENVTVQGYMADQWNTGAFLRYGTANVDGVGFDYVVEFTNCDSNIEIATTENGFGAILVGNTYPGKGSATIYVDKATDENINKTKMYSKNDYCYRFYGMGSPTTVYVDGNILSSADALAKYKANVTQFVTAETSSDDNGYYVTAQGSKVVVTVMWQYSAYNDTSCTEKDLVQTGVGGAIGENLTFEVVAGNTVNVMSKINKVEVIQNSDKWDCEVVGNTLKIYMTSNYVAVKGNVRLNVQEFKAGSNIAFATGSISIANNVTVTK